MSEGNSITIAREGEALVIRVPIKTLVNAFENNPQLEAYDEATETFRGPKVTDVDGFVEDVIDELDREEEDGTTLLHIAFDAATAGAFANGSEHVGISDG